MASSGVRISELNRYDVGKLNPVDSLLVPISYNGATKVISIGDIMSLFSNNDQDVTQNEGIAENKEAIAYLVSRLHEMAMSSSITIQNVVDTQRSVDMVQDNNIATAIANVTKQTNINASQQLQIDDMSAYLTSISYALNESINTRSETDAKHTEDISYNAAKIAEQTDVNENQQKELDSLRKDITTLETVNVWGVYNE